jgi:subfamily B ATP-binding cassette protein HlyB/CyaB
MQRTLLQADFLWLVGSFCQINRLPFDAALLAQRYPAPHSVGQFFEAAQSLGFRTGAGTLSESALPCVAFFKSQPTKPALVLRSDGEQLLYFVPGGRAPETCLSKDSDIHFEKRVLFLRHETPEPLHDDGAATEAFGFRWFWRELLRHPTVWRDVLLATLLIQLVALATPLFTQVIIDKVVVHQTQSTLVVIAVGLAMFMLFNAGMSWLRQAHREGAGPARATGADSCK